ncbi:MAG: hypothetical protein HY248_04435 [Fimbriimonas ginsengisoli]|uniref:Uncharacterized protein n=1 Tax=Fimbriimonas ginsengisoli TaxID=1005039 RepID=A0A931LTT3_FIMGI|nr:hypothetical protein [Fimbriimonas ginsengisoli]MBI3721781.1 hypothetical protein [Fimbriimonas ginsengisoli]
MKELVRYRPGEAIRWLHTGAAGKRKSARDKSRSIVVPSDARGVGENVRTAAGALVELGKGALADLLHSQAMGTEFVLMDDGLEVIRGGSTRKIAYRQVKEIELRGDRATLVLERGSLTIKPPAYLVAGRVRVPIGWSRNEIEVPYELLIEELAARCGLDLDER